MIISADLHLHSVYTKQLDYPPTLEQFATNAQLKGLDLIGTGDCLHPRWMQQIQHFPEVESGTYQCGNTRVILTTEISTKDNIHHLLLFPNIDTVTEYREIIKPLAPAISKQGRPELLISSDIAAEQAVEVGAMIGPAHIFDSFAGLYTKYNSVHECYKHMSSDIFFVELGLATNTHMADKINELHQLTFLSNSDTHNPHPIRLGREFTQFSVRDVTFKELMYAIKRENGNKPVLNVGIPPEEGKYHTTACLSCHQQYSHHQAKEKHWRCDCGGFIKKGVADIIDEKASYQPSQHPLHRPQYVSFLPLHEIITRVFHEQNPFTDAVSAHWDRLIHTFGNEIAILLNTSIQDILKIAPSSLAEAIQGFRNAIIRFHPGGGGRYGSFTIPWEEPRFNFQLPLSKKT